MHFNIFNIRSFSSFRRSKHEESDPLEDLESHIKIAQQALNALDEANDRFETQFEAWRKDWRAKIDMLEMRQAELVVFSHLNDPQGSDGSKTTTIDSEENESEIVECLEDRTRLTKYKDSLAEAPTSIANMYLPFDAEFV